MDVSAAANGRRSNARRKELSASCDLYPCVGGPRACLLRVRADEAFTTAEWHNSLHDSQIRTGVIRHPAFAKKVRNVVIECGNSLYQDSLDRFVNGIEVPRDEIQKVWRDTTQSPAADVRSMAGCEGFVEDVRAYNRSLPAASRIRVLAGDPPIDWSTVTTPEQFRSYLATRDESAFRVIEREILAKGQRGLILYGAGHIWRNITLLPTPNLATLLDKKHSGKLFTVVRLSGSYPDSEKLERMLSSSERPVLVDLQSGPVSKLDANAFLGRDVPVELFPEGLGMGKVADACIYTGQQPDAVVPVPAMPDRDPAWMAELERRRALMPRPRRPERPVPR